MKKTVLTALALVALPGMVGAETANWHCVQKNAAGREWVMKEMVLIQQTESDVWLVYDGVTKHFTGGPVAADVKRDGQTVKLKWDVRTQGSQGKRANVSYSATFKIDQGKIQISAAPRGYDNSTNIGGTCSKLK